MAFTDAKVYANIAKILQFCKMRHPYYDSDLLLLDARAGLFFAALLSKK